MIRSKSQLGVAALVAIAMFLLSPRARGDATVEATPSTPSFGDMVSASLSSPDWSIYFPVTRYVRDGNTFTIDYDYQVDGFGPSRPELGPGTIALGELAPGSYRLVARLSDLDAPMAAPSTATSEFAVAPPGELGIYTVPARPDAFQTFDIVVRSAAYVDPASMRATLLGPMIRIDFDYSTAFPPFASVQPGMTLFGSVRIPGLTPGAYHVEGWGRSTSGASAERFFTQDIAVASASTVVEYYAESLHHYFLSAGPDEVADLDTGRQPGWKRTGQGFRAWLHAEDAPAGAQPVCRFYASGPNSHFYTADASECAWLRALEQQQRAASPGGAFTGWAYEGIAFHALVPQGGQCAAGTQPVYRAYNNRAAQNDSNHRYMTDARMRAAMLASWSDEGVAFCSPQ